jgi:hypothetical protein
MFGSLKVPKSAPPSAMGNFLNSVGATKREKEKQSKKSALN